MGVRVRVGAAVCVGGGVKREGERAGRKRGKESVCVRERHSLAERERERESVRESVRERERA